MSAAQSVIPNFADLEMGQFECHQRFQPKVMSEDSKSEIVRYDTSSTSNRKFAISSPKFVSFFPKGRTTSNSSSVVFSAIPRKHKIQKPVSRGNYESARMCRAYELDMYDACIRNIPRAGVLFYTFIDDELFICFGRDRGSGDLTDFGGTRRPRETPVQCAIREGNEESRFAFSEIQPDQVQCFNCLYSSNMLIIFIPVAAPDGMDIRKVTSENFSSKQFLNRRQCRERCYNEVSDLIWLDEPAIENLFSSRPKFQIFGKVRRFIYSCNEFSKDLNEMKYILRSVIKEAEESIEEILSPDPRAETPIIRYSGTNGGITELFGPYSSFLRKSSCSPGIIRVDSYVTDVSKN